MAEVKIKEFAESVGISVERLLSQLADAGVGEKSETESISEEEKAKLLAYLRRLHGAENGENSLAAPSRVTLSRRESTKLRQPGVRSRRSRGAEAAGGDVSVVVKKKRTYVKRSQLEEPSAAEKAEESMLSTADVVDKPTVQDSQTAERDEQPLTQEAIAVEDSTSEQMSVVELSSEDTEAPKPQSVESDQQVSQETTSEIDVLTVEQVDVAPIVEKGESVETAKEGTGERPKTEEVAAKMVAPETVTKAPSKKKEKRKAKTAERADVDKRKGRHSKGGRKNSVELTPQPSKHRFEKPVEAVTREIEIGESVVVSELANRMAVKSAELVKVLMNMGVMVTINQTIDRDTATLVVEEMGHIAKDASDETPENLLDDFNVGAQVMPRAPIVTVMGHVDHGKTSLLDSLRATNVVEGEAGGITQHIGAYHVHLDQGDITFLDTPGHAAFSAMRARGARITDIVILVVAADDGVKPQTIEAINHAKAANVPIVVAVNKIDKPGADPERVMQELVGHEVIPESWGGDTMFVNVSAKTGEGLSDLLDALLLQAEVLELSAVADGPATGVIIESKLDRGRGAVATVIVTEGSLKKGDIVVAGAEYGRARSLVDENSNEVELVGPAMPIQILGLGGVPDVGDELHVVSDERKAREIAEYRAAKARELNLAKQQQAQRENIFAQIAEGELKTVNVVIKADVHGSAEALAGSLIDLSTDEVSVKVIAKGVGGINESDVNLALASNAIMIGFNVRAEATARRLIQEKGVEIRYHSIIYEALDEIRAVMSGMLEPEVRQQIIGLAEVRDVFRSSVIGDIAGCMVLEGVVRKSAPIRVLRDNVVIYEGELESLRRFKDEVSEVKSGVECGIGVKNYNNVRVGDQIEVFERVEVSRSI